MMPERYWAPLRLARDTPCIDLDPVRKRYLQEQMGSFSGFGRLVGEGEGFPKLKRLVLSVNYVVGPDDYEYISALLFVIGRQTPSLELLVLNCTLLPGLKAPLGVFCRLLPGSLPRLRNLTVHMSLDPDCLRSLFLAAGPLLKTLHVDASLCALAEESFAPLWLDDLESLSVRNGPSKWTPETSAKLIQDLLRLPALKVLCLDLPEYDEFVVRFLAAMTETEAGFGNLRHLIFYKERFKGPISRISLGAFSLFIIWYKDAYYGRAKNFIVHGLPSQSRVEHQYDYGRVPSQEPPTLLLSARDIFHRREKSVKSLFSNLCCNH